MLRSCSRAGTSAVAAYRRLRLSGSCSAACERSSAPSFGTVFYGDCFDYGLLPVTLGEEVVGRIADGVRANPEVEMTVDLARQVIVRRVWSPFPSRLTPDGA